MLLIILVQSIFMPNKIKYFKILEKIDKNRLNLKLKGIDMKVRLRLK